MALAPLATEADLTAYGLDISDTALVAQLLNAASDSIREAAGVPIIETISTIKLPSPVGRKISLPPPVKSVAQVLVNGAPVTDWRLVGNDVWRECQWTRPGGIPDEITVTATFGLAEVPADIVDLVCNMVGAGLTHAAAGNESRAGVVSRREMIDDYDTSVTYAAGDDALTSPMELPEATRQRLRARFGGGVTVVVTRS